MIYSDPFKKFLLFAVPLRNPPFFSQLIASLIFLHCHLLVAHIAVLQMQHIIKMRIIATLMFCCSISVCAGQVFSASPTAGPSSGGTIVTIFGENLSDATGCKFGNSVVAVNSHAGLGIPTSSFASGIICTAPSQGSAASVTSISAVINGDVLSNALSWTYYGKRNIILRHTIYTLNVTRFLGQLQVLALFPSSGPTLGALVTITGSGFLPSNALVCKVLGVTKPVTLISSTQVVCPLNSVSSAQSASVEVSNNNQQFTSDNKVFTFYGKLQLHSFYVWF